VTPPLSGHAGVRGMNRSMPKALLIGFLLVAAFFVVVAVWR
jgi:hypothetical protein